ncbi:alpha/beta hydrolase [Plantactinospora siamensis]|uniref:Alpha/beta hydrolase n=1 Tax=Plantactinospora siamensis TaxID=555372 RepID=A0ABV6NYX4_9ACTN
MIRQLFSGGALATLLAAGLLAPAPVTAGPAPAPAVAFDVAYRRSAAAMVAAGPPYAEWAGTGRRFLAFDPAGDGLAVEAVGDLDHADRIVVLVPGVATTLRDFDRGLGGVPGRAPARQARTVYAALRATDPAARVAVVAWLGYDPPEGLGLAAARPERARGGAARLAAFAADLAALRPHAAVTLVGHSYGALVVGLAAARLPRQVTDLVTLGGIGTGVDTAASLHTPARVWAAEAPDDWVRQIPQLRLGDLGHGVRPGSARFGARRLPTDGVPGHDGYLAPGTGTVRALAALVLRAEAVR